MFFDDKYFMEEALKQARIAFEIDEVPVGSVLVKDGKILASAYNQRERLNDPTAHAEILVLREASNKLGSWRLEGSTLYVTLEPCPMCAGAIVLSRVKRLVFGATDAKAGAAGTLMNLLQDKRLNHQVDLTGGILAEESKALLQAFFSKLRN